MREWRKQIEFLRRLAFLNRFRVTPDGFQIKTVTVVSVRIIRAENDGAAELTFGFGEIPIVKQIGKTERAMRFAESVVEFESFESSDF